MIEQTTINQKTKRQVGEAQIFLYKILWILKTDVIQKGKKNAFSPMVNSESSLYWSAFPYDNLRYPIIKFKYFLKSSSKSMWSFIGYHLQVWWIHFLTILPKSHPLFQNVILKFWYYSTGRLQEAGQETKLALTMWPVGKCIVELRAGKGRQHRNCPCLLSILIPLCL